MSSRGARRFGRRARRRIRNRQILSALVPIIGGIVASVAALAVMALMRLALQVRTVPERILEAMLLVTPLDLFGVALQWFGFDAKRYGLALISTAMFVLLSALGAWVIARRWPLRDIVLLALMLWLSVMGMLMPLTDAGPFAAGLVNGATAAIVGHGAIALAYAAALAAALAYAAGSGWATSTVGKQPRAEHQRLYGASIPSRRAALILGAGALSATLATFVAARLRPRTSATLVVIPEAPTTAANVATYAPATAPGRSAQATTPAILAPTTMPTVAMPTDTSVAQVHPTATPSPSLDDQFQPPPLRRLARDEDGIVVASGRRPGQLADVITPADDFYVVSKNAAQDPFIRLAEWRLRVDGGVQRPIEIDYRSLRNLPAVETTKTLECISNFVTKCELVPFGCDLISTARWKGVRLKDILTLAGGLKAGVTSLSAIAADDFTTTLPIEAVMDPDTLLVYEMDGRPLAREHGYPARVLIPGRYGMKNAKWVVALRPLTEERDDWYGQRSWDKEGIVKTMTRIDTPARDAELPPGTHRMAGIAYAGDRGILHVEVSADGGENWQPAEIIDRPPGRDVWVRWESSFTLPTATTLTLMARATDGDGELQTESFSLPQPDGASGWHALDVHARDDGQ